MPLAKQQATLQSLLELYFTHRLLRPASIICHKDAVASLCKSLKLTAQQIEIGKLQTEQLLYWRADVLQTCAGTSFNKHRRHIRALLNFAVSEEILNASPMAKVSAAPVGKKRPKTVPTNWLKKTREFLDQNHPKLRPVQFWRTLVDVMYFGMMRRRQVVELKWGDIHFGNNSITLSAEGSKSRKEWSIPLPKKVMTQLLELKAKTKRVTGHEVKLSRQVFCLPLFSEYGNSFRSLEMKDYHISAFYERLSALLGYTISAHRIRHTSATIMLSCSTDLKGTSEMLGHSSIALTADTYVHPSLDSLRRSQRKMLFYGD